MSRAADKMKIDLSFKVKIKNIIVPRLCLGTNTKMGRYEAELNNEDLGLNFLKFSLSSIQFICSSTTSTEAL